MGKIRRAPGLPYPNYDPASTGSFKILFVPQLNLNLTSSLTVFILEELPLYQHVNGTQIGSQFQSTFGVTWRFYLPTRSGS
jgi:hypothetical protein